MENEEDFLRKYLTTLFCVSDLSVLKVNILKANYRKIENFTKIPIHEPANFGGEEV